MKAFVHALLLSGLLLLAAPSRGALAAESPEQEAARLVREGNDLFRQGKWDEAARRYRDSLARRPDAGAWFNLGLSLAQSGDEKGALEAFRQAAGLKPDYADARRQAAAILYRQGNWAECAKEISASISGAPGTAAWKLLAAALERMGDEGSARRALESAVMADPSDPSLRTALAQSLYRTGFFEAAVEEYRFAVRLSPGNPALRRSLGYALIAAGRRDPSRLDEALDALEAAVRLDSGDAGAWRALGDLYAARDMVREAARAYASAHELKGAGAEDWYRLGSLYQRAGRAPEARAAFEKALAAEPAHAGSQLALGALDLDEGAPDRAAARFQKALETGAEGGAALAGLGDVAFQRKDFAAAAESYTKGLARSPGSASLWKRLGHAEFAAGRFGPSARAYRRALEFDPSDREAEVYLLASEKLALRRPGKEK